MKRICLSAAFIAVASFSFAQVNMPMPSPTQTIVQDFGMGKITLVYSRPSVKGRTLFANNSDLAPFGKLWRTGANAATRITFTDEVSVNGKKLDTGSYVIYTIPGEKEWTVILNKGLENWGTDGYDEKQDIARMNVPVNTVKPYTESFTMQFTDIKNESCDLHLLWGNTDIKIPITTNIKDRLKAQIEKALQGDKKPYWQAANFYYEWEKDYAKALENVNKGIEGNADAF
ncbi:MAG TPA: DUF2911 domain-containing protein, partial [Chitinophagaceae bacterium]|nr:DUF2911 domain-containing protein [Chitinophagaceae bacterium]